MIDMIVIGGGPAGMLAAIFAARSQKQVVLLEKNNKLGKKLYITGKGRCNLTNESDVEYHLNQVTEHKKFLYSAFYSFDPFSTIQFFNDLGLITKVERGQRVFPASEKSSDVIKTLSKALQDLNVKVRLNSQVESLIIDEDIEINGYKNKVNGVRLMDGEQIYARQVVVATGGMSYSVTGSDGDGYRFAEGCGHQVVEPIPGLVPFNLKDGDINDLQGLALKNVSLQLVMKERVLYENLGEMLFTHFGVSGPLVLSASSFVPRNCPMKDLKLIIDLKPGLTFEKLDKRILADFEENNRKNLKNAMGQLLPASLIPIIIERAKLDPFMPVHQLTKETRHGLVKEMKAFVLNPVSLRSFDEAIITRGGIAVTQVDPHTMESKITKGLYFAGEVLDLDALTGGFNLQIAYSTAYLAGISQ